MTTFKPAESKGYLWGIGLIAIVGLATIVPVIANAASGKLIPGFMMVMGSVFTLITAVGLYFTWAAKNMRYSVNNSELVITWAFNKKRIPLKDIRGIDRTIGTSSFKVMGASWPGFHMGSFTDPRGKGTVNLFATRLWGEILLIRTKWETIGLTPAEPEKFLDELTSINPEIESGNSGSSGEAKTEEVYNPWKDKVSITLFVLAGVLIIGAGLFLHSRIPYLPSKVPMHYNIKGEIDRYGSPLELYTPLGIGLGVVALMAGINLTIARNNRTSVRMMAIVSFFLSIIFSAVSVGMVISA